MNTKTLPNLNQINNLLSALSHPARLRILLTIGQGEACVCHLEAHLGYRQAYISQHLMALREADLLTTRREGRYIFYRLADPSLLDLIRQAGSLANVTQAEVDDLTQTSPRSQCCCPHCAEDNSC
ncbi:MAG: Biofilm growth-associated repressor [Chloroflexi bacterium]|nr:Biofilm growth-associated repressor [Chloroflexota bacterium]